MRYSRRDFVASLAAAPLLTSLAGGARAATSGIEDDRFDPWVEVSAAELVKNVNTVAKLAGGRPILAVIKNNAYGLGLTTVGPILEELEAFKQTQLASSAFSAE